MPVPASRLYERDGLYTNVPATGLVAQDIVGFKLRPLALLPLFRPPSVQIN
jgi:hypothetical protein